MNTNRRSYDNSDTVLESGGEKPRVYILGELLMGSQWKDIHQFNQQFEIFFYYQYRTGWLGLQKLHNHPVFFVGFTQVSQYMCKKCLISKYFHSLQMLNRL